ncbi:hypothetical protein GOV06_00670 [Candidatus Woesearchaeota archaeon]|nr:hypothetical protein [Candidatus Woesearchaeota archaeon]
MKQPDIKMFKEISSRHRLKLLALYTYDLTKQPKSKAVRFVYLLKGRKQEKGMIKEFNGCFIAPGCFTLPIKKDKEMQQILSYWKIPFKRKLILTY